MNGLISISVESVSMNALYRPVMNFTASLICVGFSPSLNASFRAWYGSKPNCRIDVLLVDQLGSVMRHLLNLHTARLRRHKHNLRARTVQHQTQIKLALNRRTLFDQQPLTFCPAGPVWCVTSCIPRIAFEASSAASSVFTTFTPPPLPRPPA